MLPENYLLLTCLVLFLFIQTSYSHSHCNPSSCGNIHSISHPFRLNDDPKHCGHPTYEISCDNNTTPSMYIGFHKYIVRAINYQNTTIRVADTSIKNHDTCSFHLYPQYLPPDPTFLTCPYSLSSNTNGFPMAWPLTFITCPFIWKNESIFTEGDCVNRNYSRIKHTYTYIKVGRFNAAYLGDMCTIKNVIMTSLQLKSVDNISFAEIQDAVLYGFELTWLPCGGYSRFIVVCLNLVLVVLAYFGLRFVIGVPFLLCLIIYKLRRRHLSMFDLIEGFLESHNNLMPIRYSYSNIKKMTRGFREKLGEGGYGSVYKGKLRSGNLVAVKVLNKPNTSGQDFINEVATIGRIHHINVVKLVGYCAERSKCALVYDFMPNGSLEKYIRNPEKDSDLLTWDKKYEIVIGVARGIEYLHRGCDIQILHFDIKPHNILLDEHFTPKISDFGLAKSYSVDKNTVTLTAIRGTIGYVAPELIHRSIGGVSNKADVYSFGMLLMEMIGLKGDLAARDQTSSKYFPNWIYDCFNEGREIKIGIVDENDNQIVRRMTIVALWCIQLSPCDRPSMSKVLEMLEGADELLQIPPQRSELPQQFAEIEDSNWGTNSTDSIALLVDDLPGGQ